jgi:tetratricopeptide (TPR) repeat protein
MGEMKEQQQQADLARLEMRSSHYFPPFLPKEVRIYQIFILKIKKNPHLSYNSCRKREFYHMAAVSSLQECAVCYQPFTLLKPKRPAILVPCLHSDFCEECVQTIRSRASQHLPKCPLCIRDYKYFVLNYPSQDFSAEQAAQVRVQLDLQEGVLSYYYHARALYMRDRFAEAVESLTLIKDSRHLSRKRKAIATATLGASLFHLERFAEAIEPLTAIERSEHLSDSQKATIALMLGGSLLDLERYDEAAERLISIQESEHLSDQQKAIVARMLSEAL